MVMWTGILFIVLALALALLAALMNANIRRPRLRQQDRPGPAPISGWGNDTKLPRL